MTPASDWKYNSVNSCSLTRCSGVNSCWVTAWTSASNWALFSSLRVPAGHSTAVSAANSRSSPQARRFRRVSGRAMTRQQTHVGGQDTSSCVDIFFGVVWPGEAFGTLSPRKKNKHAWQTHGYHLGAWAGCHTQHRCLGSGTESCRHDNECGPFAKNINRERDTEGQIDVGTSLVANNQSV